MFSFIYETMLHMFLTRTVLNRRVTQYMNAHGFSLRQMADHIHMPLTTFTNRLNGRSAWRDRDIDQLVNRGIVSPLWEGDEERRGMEK